VLVLNQSYEPLSICSAKRALGLICKNVAKSEKTYDIKVHTSKLWDEVTGDFINIDLYLPSVIRLLTYKYIPIRMQILSRKNILNRDRNTCQYCMKVFSPKKLTLDHIYPKSKGGKSSWSNLVTACGECNRKKGDRLLSEIDDMTLHSHPSVINIHTSRYLLRNMGADDPNWRKFLFFDHSGENQWTGELEETEPIK